MDGKDLLNFRVNLELLTTVDYRAETWSLQVPLVGHSNLTFSVETRLVRLLGAVAAVTIF